MNNNMVSMPRDEVERTIKVLRYASHPMPSAHADAWEALLAQAAAQQPVAVSPLGELNNELRYILGTMCFTCIPTVQALRQMGHIIKNRAEDEQAATIHWMLGHYLRDGDNWRTSAVAELKAGAALVGKSP